LYKRLKLEAKQQNHEKEAALRDIVPLTEQRLESVIAPPPTLLNATDYRTSFLKVLAQDTARAFLPYFLPTLDFHTSLKNICESIDAYLQAAPSDVHAAYKTACRQLDISIAEARAVHFHYATHYLAEPLAAIRESLEVHFTNLPIHRAPSITLTTSDKKYPFHLQRHELSLDIDVTNAGPGHAFDVVLTIATITDVEPTLHRIAIGDLAAGHRRTRLPVRTTGGSKDVALDLEVSWRRLDGTPESNRSMLLFFSQRSDIDWDSLQTAEPYDLEPVTSEADLIGRTDFLHDLVSMVRGASVGSAVLFGQKRVGKTSLAKTLMNRLCKDFPDAHTIIYLEGGEYVRPDPVRTIEALGRKLCEELKRADPAWATLPTPAFEGAFAPLGDFLSVLTTIDPGRRFLFVLDEFDELPTELYTHNSIADAFFLTLRSLSAKPHIGFLLIGSEKMNGILGLQGHELNKFKTIRVDYFDRQKHWGDFVDLVRKPAQGMLEISDNAVTALYQLTAGNPYFTKLLCKSLFRAMVARRDGHVTESEISAALQTELRSVGVNSFLHFWEDGIIEKGEEHKRISEARQKTLLCYSEVSRRTKRVSLQQLVHAGRAYEMSAELVEQEVDDFVQRDVFVKCDAFLEVKVGFFAEWLRESGPKELLPRLGDRIATLERKREDAAYVHDDDIRELVKAWGVYKGRRVEVSDVRSWLRQFGTNVDQRLVFKLLSKIKYFSEDMIRQRLATLLQMIKRDVTFRFEGVQPRLHDIVVSYLDGPGKSGFQYAKLFGEENSVFHENILEPSRALRVALKSDKVKAIVFIDDFLGSGQSALEGLLGMQRELGEIAATRKIPVFLCVIAGFQTAVQHMEAELVKRKLQIRVRVADPLADADRAFSDAADIFADVDEMEKAKRLVRDFGSRLEPKHPLGFNDTEGLIVFERSCPNNTLPVLWGKSADWTPLFRRQ
jgi:hypothetical protein